MESEYASIPLGRLAKLRSGYPFKSADWTEGGFPVIKIANVKGGRIVPEGCAFVSPHTAKAATEWWTREGDVLIAMTGYVGEVARVRKRERFLINQRVGRFEITPASPVLAHFLFYALQHPEVRSELETIARGSAQPNLSAKDAERIEIPVPEKAEQVKIVELLAALDDRIDLLRQTNATLESIAQAFFKSWFIDFDPVRAKAEGQEPAGLDASTAELFPSQFEDSALGVTPRGWKLVPFGELLGSTIGGDWGSEEQSTDCSLAAAIVRGTDMPDIRAGAYDRVPRRFVSPKKASKRTLVDGDLVIEVSGGSKTQPTGRSLYITETIVERLGGSVVPTSFCRLFRPRDAETGLLLAQHLDAIYGEGKMWGYQIQSTGLANFQTQHFLESELVVEPPREVLCAFFTLVRPLIDRITKSPIAELAALRDSLLPRLVSGKLRLPEAQEQVEDALA